MTTQPFCSTPAARPGRSEEHTSELQSLRHLVCRLLLEKKLSGDKFWGPQVFRRPGRPDVQQPRTGRGVAPGTAGGVGLLVTPARSTFCFFFLKRGPPPPVIPSPPARPPLGT